MDVTNQPIALIRLGHDATVELPFELLHRDDEGNYVLPSRFSDFTIIYDDGKRAIPVIEERATVRVQPAPERTMRIRRRIVVEPQVVEAPVWHERIDVQHVPVGKFVDAMPVPRREGDALVIPVVEEVVVRRLRVREELRVRVIRDDGIHRETVQLRRHELDIHHAEEPLPTPPPSRHRGD